MGQTIKIRSSYAETVSKDYQATRYGLDLECDVLLNGGDHKVEVETAAAKLFNFAKAVVARQKEAGLAVGDLLSEHGSPPPPAVPPSQSGNNHGNSFASEKQCRFIRSLCKRKKQDPEDLVQARFKRESVDALTAREASFLIEELRK
jgi:hypothetical protein